MLTTGIRILKGWQVTYRFRIASPCAADWNQMQGDDRVRFCPDCKLHVYNFSALTPPEIETLISKREGRLCARLYQRRDGRTLMKNCPVGFRAALLRASGFTTAVLSTLLSVVPASAQSAQEKEVSGQPQMASASIRLEIVDVSGAAITNARVTIKNESTGKEWTVKTDEHGRAMVSDLPKGEYRFAIASPGFATKTLTRVSLPNSELQKVQLDLGTMGGVVVVGELMPDHPNPVRKFFSKVRHII